MAILAMDLPECIYTWPIRANCIKENGNVTIPQGIAYSVIRGVCYTTNICVHKNKCICVFRYSYICIYKMWPSVL